MQHFDRGLEHLDELENALVRPVKSAREAVRVRIGLRERLQLADIDLADQRGDVLVVLIAGLGFSDRNLAQARGVDLHDPKPGDVAPELVEPLDAPRAYQAS